jgi:hypothetical protein
VLLKATIPIVHLVSQELGKVPLKVEGETVGLGPFSFRYDAAAGTLSGVVPEALAPLYQIPLVLRRVPRIEAPVRKAPSGTLAAPVWTYETGSALWAGPTFAEGTVYVGGQDSPGPRGRGAERRRSWSFHAGGA